MEHSRTMDRRSLALTPGLPVGCAAIVAILTATLVTGPANLDNVYGASDAVTHMQALKGALHRLLATAVDAETGARGFVITGQDNSRAVDRARDTINPEIAEAALTGFARDGDRDAAIRAGLQRHLTKPIGRDGARERRRRARAARLVRSASSLSNRRSPAGTGARRCR